MKYNDNGEWKDIYVKTLDSLPTGAIVDYDGTTLPDGWVEYNDYSESEINTGKSWIDGKPIYRKVVHINGLPNSTTKIISHNIQSPKRFINVTGFAFRSSDNVNIALPYSHPTTPVTIYANSTNLVVETTSDRTAWDGYAILEYTKN